MAIYSVGRRRLILLLLLTSILMLTLDLRGNRLFDEARSGFAFAFRPVESATRVATRPIVNAWRGVTQYDELADRNRELQDQIDAQRGAEVTARAAIIDAQSVLALFQIPSLNNYNSVVAEVVGRSSNNLDQIVEINKGSDDGIVTGMAVVASGGLVGKITETFRDFSYVRLVTDRAYSVAVKVLATSDAAEPTPPETAPSGSSIDDLTSTTTTTTTTTTLPGEQPSTTLPSTTTPPVIPLPTDPTAPPGTDVASQTTTSTTTTLPAVIVRDTGALEGQGRGRLPQVTFVIESSSSGPFRPGDPVETSGASESLAPVGIPVGLVRNVIDRGGEGPILEIELSANMNSLNLVRVILYCPASERC